MGLTALALLWLAERLGGPAFALGAAAAAVALVVVLALAGRGQRAGKAVGRLVWPATIVLAVLAVAALITSRAAIASLVRPSATSATTSRSRSVRRSREGRPAGLLASDMNEAHPMAAN